MDINIEKPELLLAPKVFICENAYTLQGDAPWEGVNILNVDDSSTVETLKEEGFWGPGTRFDTCFEITDPSQLEIYHDMQRYWEGLTQEDWAGQRWFKDVGWDWQTKELYTYYFPKIFIDGSTEKKYIAEVHRHVTKKYIVPKGSDNGFVKMRLQISDPYKGQNDKLVELNVEGKVKIDNVSSGYPKTILREDINFENGIAEVTFQGEPGNAYVVKVKPRYRNLRIMRNTCVIEIEE